MSNLANLYTDEIKKQFEVFYANWEPGAAVELGDYGLLDGNIFLHIGKLKDDFPEFSGDVIKITADQWKDHKEFQSESGVEVNLLSKGSLNARGIPVAKATLEVKFANKDSIFFNAADCTTTRISNKAKIGEILKTLLKNGKWKKEYCVVTDLVQSGLTILAISKSNNSEISFETDSPQIEKINLADASIKVNLHRESSIGYKVEGKEGLYIMMGLCKIKNRFIWWGTGDFEPKTLRFPTSARTMMENSSAIKTEESAEDLAFAQLGIE